jgi:hypothetical protein
VTGRERPAELVPDLWLEQYVLGELDQARTAFITRELAHSPSLRVRLEALERSDREIRAAYPPPRLVADVTARAGGRRGRRPAAVVLATTAAIGLAATPWLWSASGRFGESRSAAAPSSSDDRVKGTGAALAVYRQTPAGSEALRDGDRGRAGDLLRVGYQASRAGFGAILSVDGSGVVTRHYPLDGPTAAPLEVGALVLLNEAFELDAAPRWERFHLFASDSPFDLDPLIRALGAGGNVAAPPGLEHATLSIAKEPVP